MNDWGLFPALPPVFFVAVVLLVVSIGFALSDETPSTVRLGVHLAALIVVLHGTIPAAFALPNYPWAYKHIGVASYINLHGGVDTTIDVYHNWPGFFAVAGFLTKLAGTEGALSLARWAPIYFNLLMSLELAFAFRALPIRRRERWLALFVFVAANWVGQDYFAPQAMGFVLAMAAVGAALNWLAVGDGSGGRSARRATPAAVLAVFAAIVVTHILSPFMVLFGLGVVTAAGKLRPRWLVLALAAMAGTFLAAHYFSLPHTGFMDAQDLMEVLGHPFGSNPTGAVPAVGRRWTALGAPGLLAFVWGLGAVGVIRRLRSGRPTLVLAGLAMSPVLTLLLSGYGGEAILRIYLFSLPWAALLCACALDRRRTGMLVSIALTAIALMFMSAFYGSEELYHIRPGEVRAAQYFYDHAEPGSVLVTAAQQFPEKVSGRYAGQFIPSLQLLTTLDDHGKPFGFHRRMLGPADVPKVAEFIDYFAARRTGGAYVVLSAGQRTYAQVLGLSPPGALAGLGRALVGSSDWTVFYRNADATIYRFARDHRGSKRPARHLPSTNRRPTDWGELVVAMAGLTFFGVRGRREMTQTIAENHARIVTDGAIVVDVARERAQSASPSAFSVSSSPTETRNGLPEEPVIPAPLSGRPTEGTAELVRRALVDGDDGDLLLNEVSRRPDWPHVAEIVSVLDVRQRPAAIRFLFAAWGRAPCDAVRTVVRDPWPPMRAAILGAIAVTPASATELARILAEDYSEQVRVAAIYALAAAPRADQRSALNRALADPEPRVRAAAIDVLPAARGAEALPVLLAAAGDEDDRVRRAAGQRLAGADDWVLWMALRERSAFEDVLSSAEAVAPGRAGAIARHRFTSPDPEDRLLAIMVALRDGTRDHDAIFMAGARDADVRVRAAALEGLRGRSDRVDVIAAALSDPHPFVRRAATGSMAEIEHDTAVDELIGALADPDADVRDLAVAALAWRASAGLAGRLGAVFSTANAATVGDVLLRMGRVGEAVLLQMANEESARSAAAVELLRGSRGIVQRIDDVHALHPDRRLKAVDTVGRLGTTESVAPLIDALSDPCPPIRSAAVRHLVQLRDTRGLEAVRRLLETEQDPATLEEAQRALGAMSSRASRPSATS